MEVIKEWLSNPILFALAALFFYGGKRLFDHLFEFVIKKTRTEYVSKYDFDKFIVETKKEIDRSCKFNREACSAHRHESLAWLEPAMKKVIRQNVEVKKLIHLMGTKMDLDEKILASLINGDMDAL